MSVRVNLLHLKRHSIQEQLHLEEALLEKDASNWCILNEGAKEPAIVMGAFCKPKEWIDFSAFQRFPLPIIQRFSGGGTVVVDEQTLFVTWIFNQSDFPIGYNGQKIMQWTAEFYRPLFPSLPFAVRENDYVIGQKKCAGNAQHIRKDRWLHHTSFLWNYSRERMALLSLPQKQPKYRSNRNHCEFLCCLERYFPSRSAWTAQCTRQLKISFQVTAVSPGTLFPLLSSFSSFKTTLLSSFHPA